MGKLPEQYEYISGKFKDYHAALRKLGEAARKAGPIDEKTGHLIQLAAAAAIRSEGSVHSHARRALEAGASAEEVYHALLMITSTIGFPTVSAAISWVDDVIKEK
jgi:alkylhydroperoxidase/carboxymuconolactone decarboxylase family protein YurZ